MKKIAFIALAAVAFLGSCKDANKEVPTIDPQTTATETTSTEATAPQNTNTVATTEGLNPEHGQPGHRCDIQVGQPLNSPAGTPAPTNVPVAAPAENQPFLVNDNAKAPASASGKTNPEHGQPGHRCDIAVGQPLP